MSHTKSKHGCTIQELNEWFKAKFEKLGWMAIIKEHGHDIKISAYLQSISHLQECIKDKIEIIHDPDSKVDLKIMLKKTEMLSIAANKLLDSKLSDSSKHKKHYHNEKNDATFCGIHKWENSMFEKLGWMVLAKNEGNNLKIKSYFYSIHYLKSMIMKKMEEVHEKDRKDDLKILYDQACILWRAAVKILGNSNCMSRKIQKSVGKGGIVHSTESPTDTVVKINKKGKKYLTSQTSKSITKYNKPRYTRKNRNASKNKSSGSIFGGLF